MWRAPAAIAVVLLLVSLLSVEGLHLEQTIALPADVVVRYAAISPTGTFVAGVCRDQKLRLWDLSSGSLSQTLDLAGEKLISMRFSDDGRLLAAGGGSGRVGSWGLPSARRNVDLSSPSLV